MNLIIVCLSNIVNYVVNLVYAYVYLTGGESY